MPTVSAAAVPWNKRTAALVQVAATLGAREGGGKSAAGVRRRTLAVALRSLAAFADKQFALFGSGFDQGRLTADAKYPPGVLLEAAMRQVGYDIDVLCGAAAQREEDNSTPEMRATLELGDRLAAAALAPAVQRKLIEETAVVVYFQKSPMIRLLPYVPLALIGVDLTAIADSARLLAIAHEAGHHVYRQLTVNYSADYSADYNADYNADLDRQVVAGIGAASAPAPVPEWLAAWREEVFADVYSVLVAGPAAGLSVQAMLMSELPAAMLFDDGDHPLPALRPEIAVTVLRALAARRNGAAGRKLENAADALQQAWYAHLGALELDNSFAVAATGAHVPLVDARRQLQSSVDQMLAGPLAAFGEPDGHALWSGGLDKADTGELPALYAQFNDAAGKLKGSVPELVLKEGGKRVAVEPQVAGVAGGERVVGQIGDPHLDGLRDAALQGSKVLAPAEWLAVYLAGDWVTETGGSGITPVR